jgi:hypothetical protein
MNQGGEEDGTPLTHLVVLPRSEITDWVLPTEENGATMLINSFPIFIDCRAG